MAVRLALGATRGHLLRQMLTESVLLSLAGGLFGVALSLWATHALAAFRLAAPVPLDLSVNVNSAVLLYAFVLSVGAGILFGLAPAWSVARPVIASTLKGEDLLARPGRCGVCGISWWCRRSRCRWFCSAPPDSFCAASATLPASISDSARRAF